MDPEGSITTIKYVSLMLIFVWHATAEKEKDTVSIVFGGDVNWSGITKYMVNQGRCTYNKTMQKLRPYIKDADFKIVNLEGVLNGNKSLVMKRLPNKLIRLISEDDALLSLKYAGFDTVSLANNHIYDYMEIGVNTTIEALDKLHIKYIGLSYGEDPQKPLILEKNGIKIGILAYCLHKECTKARKEANVGAAVMDVSQVVADVKKLRKGGCNIVILFIHWDVQYTKVMSVQVILVVRNLLKQNISVDIIVGCHPHTTHRHFYVKNKTLIASSLGNLFFHDYMSANTNFQDDQQYKNLSKQPHYAKLWFKQWQSMDDITMYGRLLKIEVNRNGVIPEKSMYLPTKIYVADGTHCLYVDKEKNKKWSIICGEDDKECLSRNGCNQIECDNNDPLPPVW